MANKHVFAQQPKGKLFPTATGKNTAGLPTFERSGEEALATLALTSTFNGTYYSSEADQVNKTMELVSTCDPNFVAQVAFHAYAERRKDFPVFLCAWLSGQKVPLLFKRVFREIMHNATMIRKFVQIIRSGVVGRKSLGTLPKREVGRWLNERYSDTLLRELVGTNPTMRALIKLAHPKPKDAQRSQIFRYLCGYTYDLAALPELYQAFEAFKKAPEGKPVPPVDFRQLSALKLTLKQKKEIFHNGGFTFLRMNLNTAQRWGVMDDPGMVAYIASVLSDAEVVRKVGVYPYQLYTTYQAIKKAGETPEIIKTALKDALDASLQNIPHFEGRKLLICPDVSGSMHCPVSGHREGATTVTSCHEAAALVAAALLRKNPSARIMPFSDEVVDVDPSTFLGKSVFDVTAALSAIPSGRTRCAAPLDKARATKDNEELPDLIIFLSDYESNIVVGDTTLQGMKRTETLSAFLKLKARNPKAQMVCIDMTVPTAQECPSYAGTILNLAGWSDSMFDLIHGFVYHQSTMGLVDTIKKIQLFKDPLDVVPSPA